MATRRPDPNESEQYKKGWAACKRGTRRNENKSGDWLRGWDHCHAGRFGDLEPFEFAEFN